MKILIAAALAAGLAFIAPAAHAHVPRADIATVATNAGQFQTLLAAANAAGLVPTLRSRGPLTVFAPTDAAFSRLPAGTVQRLLRPENRGELRRILAYHVVPGRVTASDLSGVRQRVRTVAGPSVRVDGRRGVVVNDARVVRADIGARNGVIHVIDRVLLPPAQH
ncbi:MAG: fasciclin domain-containing protein [Alphaproteobacteria bacterium]